MSRGNPWTEGPPWASREVDRPTGNPENSWPTQEAGAGRTSEGAIGQTRPTGFLILPEEDWSPSGMKTKKPQHDYVPKQKSGQRRKRGSPSTDEARRVRQEWNGRGHSGRKQEKSLCNRTNLRM